MHRLALDIDMRNKSSIKASRCQLTMMTIVDEKRTSPFDQRWRRYPAPSKHPPPSWNLAARNEVAPGIVSMGVRLEDGLYRRVLRRGKHHAGCGCAQVYAGGEPGRVEFHGSRAGAGTTSGGLLSIGKKLS